MRWRHIAEEVVADGLRLSPDEWRTLIRAHERLSFAGRTAVLAGVVLGEPSIATCALMGRVTTGDYGVYCAIVCWMIAIQSNLAELEKMAAIPEWLIEQKALRFWRGVSFRRLEAAVEYLTGTGEKPPQEEDEGPAGWGAIIARLAKALGVDGDTIRRMTLKEIQQAQDKQQGIPEEVITIRRILDDARARGQGG